MKTWTSLISLGLLLLPPSGYAASAQEEARFVAAVKQAFVKHDADALVSLTCWERVPAKLKTDRKQQYLRDTSAAAPAVKEVALLEPKQPGKEWNPDDDPRFIEIDPNWKESGAVYHSNLPIVKQLEVTFMPIQADAKTTLTVSVTYPVGEKDGKLYFIEPAPAK
jgi:hypothetical protein